MKKTPAFAVCTGEILVEILVQQLFPQGVFVCDNAGIAINKISLYMAGCAGVSGMGSEVESEGGDATELGSTGLSLAKVSPWRLKQSLFAQKV